MFGYKFFEIGGTKPKLCRRKYSFTVPSNKYPFLHPFSSSISVSYSFLSSHLLHCNHTRVPATMCGKSNDYCLELEHACVSVYKRMCIPV